MNQIEPKIAVYLQNLVEKTMQQIQLILGLLESIEHIVLMISPESRYYNVILKNEDDVTSSTISRDYGLSVKKFHKLLGALGVLVYIKSQKVWRLNDQYADKGYNSIKDISIAGKSDFAHRTLWTQDGRIFIYRFLKSKGILPLIERESEE